MVVLVIAALVVVVVSLLALGGIPGSSPSASVGLGPSFPVTFAESGLPPGTSWSVDLGIWVNSSTTSTVAFVVPNGQYPFLIIGKDGYGASPSSGTVLVNGSAKRMSVVFQPSVPLDEEFAWGTPVNDTGITSVACPVALGHYCFGVEVTSVGVVNTSQVGLILENLVLRYAAWPPNVTISLLSRSGASLLATYAPATAEWNLTPPFNGLLRSGDTVMIYTAGVGGSNDFRGLYCLVAVGENGFSGTVVSSWFP